MADQSEIDATIDRLHEAGATDDEVTSIVREKYGKPFDAKAQVATMRANMGKQHEGEQPPESEFTPAKIGARALAGASGEVEGAAAGLAAPALALYHAVRHPIDTAEAVGAGALGLGYLGTRALAHPLDTLEAAKAVAPKVADAVVKFASDPTNVGRVAGGAGAAIALGPLTAGAKATKVGQAVLESAENAPLLGKVVQAVSPSNATLNKKFRTALTEKVARANATDAARAPAVVAPTVVPKLSKAEEEAARLAANGVVPTADISASNPDIARAIDARPPLAGRYNMDIPDPHAAVKGLVVPTADAAASMPSARAAVMRRPYTPASPDSPLALLRERMGLLLDQSPNAQTMAEGIAEPTAPAGRLATPTHLQEGYGARGQESSLKGPAALVERQGGKGGTAEFGFEWPGVGTQYKITSGPRAGSHVSAATLKELGIEVPATPTGAALEESQARALIGSRGKGAMPLAERKALFDALVKRSAQ